MKRVKCYQCTMTFRVEKPWYCEHRTERVRCPDCRRPFWSVVNMGEAIVGMTPEDAAQWHPEEMEPA